MESSTKVEGVHTFATAIAGTQTKTQMQACGKSGYLSSLFTKSLKVLYVSIKLQLKKKGKIRNGNQLSKTIQVNEREKT